MLKNFWRTDYRGVVAQLRDNPLLVPVLALRTIPHFTTLQKASCRLLKLAPVRRLLEASIRLHFGQRRRVKSVAADSTGLESTSASAYFVRRRVRVTSPWKTVVYHRYPKLGLVCDIRTHFLLAGRAGRGPRPDVDEFRALLEEALRCVRPERICATRDMILNRITTSRDSSTGFAPSFRRPSADRPTNPPADIIVG